MYVGKLIPLHAGFRRPGVCFGVESGSGRGDSEWAAGAITDGTVTSADELRTLVAKAKGDGYAISAGEREDSASGLSAPVFDSSGDILGALMISGPTLRMPRQKCEEWVDLLVGYAEQVTRTIGGRIVL